MGELRGDEPVQAAPRPVPRWARVAVPALLLVHALACWLARPIGYLTGQDDIEYMVLGQSLRQGGYNILFRVDQPLHAQYPPGYPAMLAVWGWVTGDGFDALVSLNVLLSVGVLFITWLAVRRVFDDRIAIVTLAVLALNPGLISAGGNIASESPFTFLSMLALLLTLSGDRSAARAGWCGALAVLAALTRSAGIVLIGAVALHWLMERKWKRLGLLTAASVVLVGGWLLWTAVSPEQHVGSSYVADLQAAVRPVAQGSNPYFTRVLRRLTFYVSRGGPYTLAVPSVPGTPIDNIVTITVLSAGLAAGLWLLLRRWRAAGYLLLLYGVLLLAWTWRAERFLIPLVPLLVPAFLAGISVPFERRRPMVSRIAVAVAAVLLIAEGASRTGSLIAQRSGCRDWMELPPAECVTPLQAGFFAAAAWMKDNVPAEDVILVSKPGALWYYTGHESISYPTATAQEVDGWVPYLREQGARWIVLSALEQAERHRHARLIEENCESLALEGRFPERTYLFRLRDDVVPGDSIRDGSGEACEAVREYRNAPERQAPE